MRALIAKVRATPSIRVLEGYEADELIVSDGRVEGVRLLRPAAFGNGAYEFFPLRGRAATGGAGGLFAITTNPGYARGEAIAMAARVGAVIADAEFVQFHPTGIDVGADPAPLATEALRGEGAILINGKGERFMPKIDPRAELSPRDIVARGVFAEIAAGRGAYLECRTAIGRAFPGGVPHRLRLLQGGRHRSRHAADPGGTRRPLPHGRHRHRRARALNRAGLGPWARSPRPACTAPTGSPPTRCSKRSFSAPAPPPTSPRSIATAAAHRP